MKALLKTTRKCWGLALALCLVCIIGFGIFFSFYLTGQKEQNSVLVDVSSPTPAMTAVPTIVVPKAPDRPETTPVPFDTKLASSLSPEIYDHVEELSQYYQLLNARSVVPDATLAYRPKIKWKTTLKGYPLPGTENLANDDTHIFVTTSLGWVYSLDQQTGTVVWQVLPSGKEDSQQYATNPVVFKNKLYVFIDNLLHALDVHTGRVIWSFPVTSGAMTQPVGFGNLLFFGEAYDGQRLFAVDADSGEIAWINSTMDGFNAPLFISDGLLTFVSDLFSFKGHSPTLYQLEPLTGKVVTQVELYIDDYSIITFVDPDVIAVSRQNNKYYPIADSEQGMLLFNTHTHQKQLSNNIFYRGSGFVWNNILVSYLFDPQDLSSASVAAFNLKTRKNIWETEVAKEYSPTHDGYKYLISDEKTVVTDCSTQVCFLDILTGEVTQQSWLFGEMMSGPPIILKNNELVVSTKKEEYTPPTAQKRVEENGSVIVFQ